MDSTERTLQFKGNTYHITGRMLRPGDRAPDATLVDQNMAEVKLSQWAGKPRVISVILSVDTSVCDTQTRRFNEAVTGIGEAVPLLTVTADLPFAMKRWCGAAGLNVTMLSDYRTLQFGDAYGVHVEGLQVLQRSVFVIDAGDVVRFAEYVPAFAQHPDYEAALAALQQILQKK